MVAKIEKVLDQHVRPVLKEHYGDIKLDKFENGILEIEMQGNCKSCPSAKFTVIDVVEVELKKYIPEVKNVILKENINEDMLRFAKEILNHERIL